MATRVSQCNCDGQFGWRSLYGSTRTGYLLFLLRINKLQTRVVASLTGSTGSGEMHPAELSLLCIEACELLLGPDSSLVLITSVRLVFCWLLSAERVRVAGQRERICVGQFRKLPPSEAPKSAAKRIAHINIHQSRPLDNLPRAQNPRTRECVAKFELPIACPTSARSNQSIGFRRFGRPKRQNENQKFAFLLRLLYSS